jgi:hypothetical protein
MGDLRPPPPDDWTRLASGLLAAGATLWMRPVEIAARYMREGLAAAAAGSGGAPGSADLLRVALREARHGAAELALVPWLALDQVARAWEPAAAGAVPSAHVVEGRPVLLPVRVLDAAQGMIVCGVPATAAQAQLGGPAAPVHVVRLGDTTPLVLFAVQHRLGDLGAYEEIGAGLVVAPRDRPLVPGLLILDFPVNARLPCVAGREIWGYAKREAPVSFAWETDRARCVLGDPEMPLVTLTFPRGGGGSTTAVPCRTYTLAGEGARLLTTTFTRTGRGERLRMGPGAARIALAAAEHGAGDPLWRLLDALSATTAPVLAHGWTEHMSAEFGPAAPV